MMNFELDSNVVIDILSKRVNELQNDNLLKDAIIQQLMKEREVEQGTADEEEETA